MSERLSLGNLSLNAACRALPEDNTVSQQPVYWPDWLYLLEFNKLVRAGLALSGGQIDQRPVWVWRSRSNVENVTAQLVKHCNV